MEIIIEGSRSTDQNWLKAQQVPVETLPELTEGQKRIARNFGVADEAYARSIYAGEISQPVLVEKAQHLGKILESLMSLKAPGAEVVRMAFQTAQGVFQVLARAEGKEFSFRVQENLVDELMEGGDAEAFDRLQRIIEFALLPFFGKAPS